MSRVDVVIPCYKYARYLRGCVESVLSQEGMDVRVLIIDDCSPDNTREVAAELVRQDSRVEYRRHAVNQRHIATYNEGLLEWATSEYSLLLSADDSLAPGALGRAAVILDTHPNVVLVHGKQVSFDHETRPLTREESSGTVSISTGEQFIEGCVAGCHNPVATPTAVVRTSIQHLVGGYRKTLPHSGDVEMWLRFAARGEVARVPVVQAFKRMHATNMQHAFLVSPLGGIEERHKAFASFFRHEGHLLMELDRLRELGDLKTAEVAFWAGNLAFERGDVAGCRLCGEFALRLCPDMASRPEWARLRWKRRLGPRTWRLLRPLVNWLRSRGLTLASNQ